MVVPAAIVTFELVYQVFLVLDAVRRKNIVQVQGVAVNNLSMIFFSALALSAANEILFAGEKRKVQSPFVVVLATLSTTTLSICLVGWKLVGELSWYADSVSIDET